MSKKGGRKAEPRIASLDTHVRDVVCLSVAAAYLHMDRRALNAYIDLGHIGYVWEGRMRKIPLNEIRRFEEWQHKRAS